MNDRKFSGSPVVRIPSFHCRGPRSIPDWQLRSHKLHSGAKKNLEKYIPYIYLLKHVKLHTICEYMCMEFTYTTFSRVAISEQSTQQSWEAVRNGFSRISKILLGGYNGCLQ